MQLRASILRPREPRLHASPCPQRLLVLDINIKMRGAADEYFEQLGVSRQVRALIHAHHTWLWSCKGICARWRRRRCV